jgi:hypothetical protein
MVFSGACALSEEITKDEEDHEDLCPGGFDGSHGECADYNTDNAYGECSRISGDELDR